MTTQVDLVLPGLFNLSATDVHAGNAEFELSVLNTLLRFGHQQTNHNHDIDDVLVDCLGLDPERKLPFASAFTHESSASLPGRGIIFRGVHLKPDLRNAFLMPLSDDSRFHKDFNIIINELQELFKQDCDIDDLGNGFWLMHLKQCQPPGHYPHYLSVVGRKVDQYIEQSRHALPWYQLINEMQMFMHSHAVNQQRQADGELLINSLWCWGAGQFQMPLLQKSTWYCDDGLMQGYAGRAGIACQPLHNLVLADFGEDALIIDLSLQQALKSTEDQNTGAIIDRIEKQILQPLLAGIGKGKIQLRLRAGHDFDLLLTRRSMLKFWRKSTRFVEWLN